MIPLLFFPVFHAAMFTLQNLQGSFAGCTFLMLLPYFVQTSLRVLWWGTLRKNALSAEDGFLPRMPTEQHTATALLPTIPKEEPADRSAQDWEERNGKKRRIILSKRFISIRSMPLTRGITVIRFPRKLLPLHEGWQKTIWSGHWLTTALHPMNTSGKCKWMHCFRRLCYETG